MDLTPRPPFLRPDQVVTAAGNVAHKVLYGGLADLRPLPRTLIDDGLLREVYHYRPAAKVQESGEPVLLVTPLAAPAICFDLRRGCSLVEHFVWAGRPTYVVEYGQVSFKDRNLGMEHWIDEVVPEAIRTVSEHAGGKPVHVVGWSLGGIFSILTAADRPDLPIGSVTVVGSPFDVTQVPLVAPLRPLLNLRLPDRLRPVTAGYRVLGGAPQPLVRWAFQLSAIQKHVTKPIAQLKRLDDTEFLAQIEAVDRFTANMIAYPGRTFGQLYHRFVRANAFKTGRIDFGDRTIDLAAVDKPVLVFAGAGDGIAPIPAVRAIVPLLTGAPEVRFEIVPGGHLGMLTGRAARTTTWAILDEWIEACSAAAPRRTASKAAAKAAPRKAAAKKAAPAKAAKKPVTKTATKTAGKAAQPATPTKAARKVAAEAAPEQASPEPSQDRIGSNPTRRYRSSSSRNLAP